MDEWGKTGDHHDGIVYLVGAGPGDPGLITRRGYDVLHHADAICVDALVDPVLLADVSEDVERYYVGKHAGYHTLKQEGIQELIIRLAKEGKRVVRLKGGDPFVFGRGGEEALALREAGIPFEIVPGVTAAVAASAYAGIPITQRKMACFALMLTAHEMPDKDSSCATLPWPEIAKLTGGTIAGYMGVKTLPKVIERLVDGGMDPETPAALIERGTMGGQKVVTSTLLKLADDGQAAGIKPPALFVIGEVVSLSEQINWLNPAPLAGKRVMVTRPALQAMPMIQSLQQLGATVVPAPTIRVAPTFIEASWKRMLAQPDRGGWIIFTSENGVRYFMEGLDKAGKDVRFLGRFKIAAIGSGTRDELASRGLKADFVPSRASTAVLSEELPAHLEKGEWVIRVRGNLGDTNVEKALAAAGAEVQAQYVYETVTAPLNDLVRAWVHDVAPDVITFTSGSAFTGFLEQWGEEAEEILRGAKLASVGPFTSRIIRDEGYDVAIEADPYNVPGLVDAIRKDCEQG